jgi:hypothetical protein
VYIGVTRGLVGEAVSLGVDVKVWLEVLVNNNVGVVEGIGICVNVNEYPPSQGGTPAKPRLYASSTL